MDRLTELERKLANLLRPCSLLEVDLVKALCRVKSGALESAWIPWFTRCAGEDRDWRVPSIGEQGMMFSPGGDPAQAFVLFGIYSTAMTPPLADAPKVGILFRDGSAITYDSEAHLLSAAILGDVQISATGNLLAEISGDISASAVGSITVDAGGNLAATAVGTASIEAAAIDLTAATITLNGTIMLNGPLTAGGGSGGGGATFVGAMSITGAVDMSGNVDITGSLTNNGKSVGSDLRVTGVTPGPGESGTPV